MTHALTHLNDDGHARMVDVATKTPTLRIATAQATVDLGPTIAAALRDHTVPKGDALAVARIAGIAAAKRTPDLLPLAHVIGIHGVTVDLVPDGDIIRITATVRTTERTGVEMEALTAASVSALALIDMVKGLDKSVRITCVELVAKSGGRSGPWQRGTSGEQ